MSTALFVTPALANDIEWVEVPGSRTRDPDFGEYAVVIGSNTIVRDGDAINFDYLHGADAAYARVAGNCRTGWKTMLTSGTYAAGSGELVFYSTTPTDFNPSASAGPATLALLFACRLSQTNNSELCAEDLSIEDLEAELEGRKTLLALIEQYLYDSEENTGITGIADQIDQVRDQIDIYQFEFEALFAEFQELHPTVSQNLDDIEVEVMGEFIELWKDILIGELGDRVHKLTGLLTFSIVNLESLGNLESSGDSTSLLQRRPWMEVVEFFHEWNKALEAIEELEQVTYEDIESIYARRNSIAENLEFLRAESTRLKLEMERKEAEYEEVQTATSLLEDCLAARN